MHKRVIELKSINLRFAIEQVYRGLTLTLERDIVKSGVWQDIRRRPAVGLTRCCHRPEYHR